MFTLGKEEPLGRTIGRTIRKNHYKEMVKEIVKEMVKEMVPYIYIPYYPFLIRFPFLARYPSNIQSMSCTGDRAVCRARNRHKDVTSS